MGDRAVFVCRDDAGCYSPGIYIHWGGAQALLYLCQAAPAMPKKDVYDAAARLCGVLHQIIPGTEYLSLLPPPEGGGEREIDWDSYSPGDAGVIVVNVDTGVVECFAGYLKGQSTADLAFAETPKTPEGLGDESSKNVEQTQTQLPDLVTALRDPDWFVAASAAGELARIGELAMDAIPVMIELLNSPDANVRGQMARALGLFGPMATCAVESLILLFGDTAKCWHNDEANSFPVRFRAAFAIANIDPSREEVLPVVREALSYKEYYARAEAHGVVRRRREDLDFFKPMLMKEIKHRDPVRRMIARITLAIIDPSYDDQDEMVRRVVEMWQREYPPNEPPNEG